MPATLAFESPMHPWIALLDSDDEWKPEKLEFQINCIKNQPDPMACHTDEEWIRKGNQVIPPKFLNKAPENLFLPKPSEMSDLPIIRSYPPEGIFRNWLIRRIPPGLRGLRLLAPPSASSNARACRPKARRQARRSPGATLHIDLGNGPFPR